MCVCASQPRRVMTLSSSDTHSHTVAEEKNEEDMKEIAQGGRKDSSLHGALFSKSTPSLEPEKVYSKGQGSPWRHSFCSLCHAIYMFNLASIYVFLSVKKILCVSLCVHKHILYFSFKLLQVCVLNGGFVICHVHSAFQWREIQWQATPSEGERLANLCGEHRGIVLVSLQYNTTALYV